MDTIFASVTLKSAGCDLCCECIEICLSLWYIGLLVGDGKDINSQGCFLSFPSWEDISFVHFMGWIKLNIKFNIYVVTWKNKVTFH